jgi:RNA polymerase sigma factor (sigma-70 family)
MGFSDQEIIDAIRTGKDSAILKHLYATLFPKVRRYIVRHAGDRDVAFDVFQDAMVILYKYIKNNKFDTQYAVGAFVYTVSRNMWLNRLRKEKREVKWSGSEDWRDEGSDMITDMISREREDLVAKLLGELGKRCEEILRLSVYQRLRNREIMEQMGFSSEDAVKTGKYKCMQKLIALIESRPMLKQTIQGI